MVEVDRIQKILDVIYRNGYSGDNAEKLRDYDFEQIKFNLEAILENYIHKDDAGEYAW